MESNHFIQLHDGLEVYYPLGVSAWGAATAILLTSPEAKRIARRTTRRILYLGWACMLLAFPAIRFLGAGLFAVPVDLAVMALHNSIAIRATRQLGHPLPSDLALRLCADAIGDRLAERILQAWIMLVMCIFFIGLFAFGNLPAFWTFGVSTIVFSLYNLSQLRRLAASVAMQN